MEELAMWKYIETSEVQSALVNKNEIFDLQLIERLHPTISPVRFCISVS